MKVPFVNVLSSMLDPDQPLTAAERDEWGDPNDAQALFALSTAYLATRRYDAAYETGRKAFRLSGDSTTRYHAARVAAIAAMGAERPMQSQFWLRRAGDNAPSEAERDKIRRQFSYLRYETPFRFQFDASISPSSNVNSGADSANRLHSAQ